MGRSNTTETTLNIQFWENHHWQMKYYITPMFISLERSWYINSHDFHWGCRSASLIEGALPCDLPTMGVMGVRKQSMNHRCLQLARWRLEYNPLWGKGVLAEPLHSALMWAPFDLLFIFFLFFEQRFPHFSMEGFWKDFQIHWKTLMYLQGTMWRHESRLIYPWLHILLWHQQV